MKPAITRVAGVPLTSLVSCHRCYWLISFNPDQIVVRCPACGTTVRESTEPAGITVSTASS